MQMAEPTGLAVACSRTGSTQALWWSVFYGMPKKLQDSSASENQSDCRVKREGGQEVGPPVSQAGHHYIGQAARTPYKTPQGWEEEASPLPPPLTRPGKTPSLTVTVSHLNHITL